jgi:hypothetical protein
MEQGIRPTADEKEFLTLAYNRFFDLFEEIIEDPFWEKQPEYRLSRTKEIFSVYFEILKYPPIQWVIENNKRPNFSDVGKDLFKFIRNVLFHFPFFDRWDDIWVKKSIVNLYSPIPQFIDKFLSANEGKDELKYRFWEEKHKRMTYISIKFPNCYGSNEKIFLKDILTERDGIKFSCIFMNNILKTQIKQINEKPITTQSS